MSSDNPYGRGPLYSHGWDEREEQRRQQHRDYGTGSRDISAPGEDPDRGGYTHSPGSNYAAGSFSGIAQGQGYYDNSYQGYYGGGNSSRDFAAHYSHEYGRDDYHRPQNQQDIHHEAYLSGGNYAGQRWEHYDRGEGPGGASLPPPGSGRTEGPHRGKGPKNYRRSDERIREDVSDRLADDPYVDASDIHIKVEDGNVVLSGRVDHRDTRRRVVALAESVRGVTNVESHLRTGQGFLENIAHAVTAAIGDVTLGPDVSTVETPKKGRKRKPRE